MNDTWDGVPEVGEGGIAGKIGGAILDRVFQNANARMVYGEPVRHEDRTVIPVARVQARFGFGGGSGGGSAADQGTGSGGGGGGGGQVSALPVGYIEMTSQGTRFIEIEDSTQIALAGMRIGLAVT